MSGTLDAMPPDSAFIHPRTLVRVLKKMATSILAADAKKWLGVALDVASFTAVTFGQFPIFDGTKWITIGLDYPIVFPFAGALTPTGSADTYTTDSSGTSVATVPVQYTFPFGWTLKTIDVFTYVNSLASDMTINVKVTHNGVTSIVATATITHGVTGHTQISVNADLLSGDALDLELVGSGSGTARLSAVAYGRASVGSFP